MFAAIILPLIFTSKKFLQVINTKKILLLLIVFLMFFSSMRIIYNIYPQAIADPINAIEDSRMTKTNIGSFMNNYYDKLAGGKIVIDRTQISRSQDAYTTKFLSTNSLSSIYDSDTLLIFNIHGLLYGSIYIPENTYFEAYNFSLGGNLLYNNGEIIISNNP